MSGYRQSSFDPNAYDQPGPPLRPYNWVQWTGVALGAAGLALLAVYLLGRVGALPRWIDDPAPASFVLPLLGVTLINSRRQPSIPIDDEQKARNRRTLLITVALCAAALGAAAVIASSGA